jgi:hypothetical protein
VPFADSYPLASSPAAGDRVLIVHTNEDGSTVVQRTAVGNLVAGTSLQNNVTAAVGGQSVAAELTGQVCTLTAVPVGGGCILTAPAGQTQKVFNRCGTGQVARVFPIEGMAIENNATNVAVTVADGDAASFTNNGTIFLVS